MNGFEAVCRVRMLETCTEAPYADRSGERLPPPPYTPDPELRALLEELYVSGTSVEAAERRIAELRSQHPGVFAVMDEVFPGKSDIPFRSDPRLWVLLKELSVSGASVDESPRWIAKFRSLGY
jgi:hypothetical protein